MKTIRLASDLTFDSVVDGSGIRTVIWTQGCPHNCKECHNPGTHNIKGGYEVSIDEVLLKILKADKNVTFSGGDPFVQPEACSILAKSIKEKGYNIWAYSGWTFEQLIEKSKKDKFILDFLKNIDILVDGPFILEKKNLELSFRGSSNQRIINVPLSLASNKIVLENYDSDNFVYTKQEGIFI